MVSEGLNQIKGLIVDVAAVETNIVSILVIKLKLMATFSFSIFLDGRFYDLNCDSVYKVKTINYHPVFSFSTMFSKKKRGKLNVKLN